MKKKILCFMLAIFMILPTFAIAGCGDGGGDSIPQSWEILKAEAELTLPCEYRVESDYAHSAHVEIEVPLEDGDVTYFYTDVVDSHNTVYHMGIKNGTSTRELLLKKYYGPLLYGGTGSTYRIQGDEGHEGESMREVDETYFKSFGVEELDSAYRSLNNYIANNWEAFTPYVEMDSRGQYHSDKLTDEKLNALRDYGIVINMYICDTAQMNESSSEIARLGIDKVAVYRKAGLKVTFWKGNKYWTISYSNDTFTTAVNNLLENKKFAIKGGPSTTDPDYCEYYFDGTNGFRMYTPNNTAVENRTDAYYKKNSDNTYTLYTKQTSDGSWVTTSAS